MQNNQYKNLNYLSKVFVLGFRTQVGTWFRTRDADLKVQSCKLHSSKYMTASTQIANTDVFAFIAVLIFKLFSRKVLFLKKKDNRNC